jgi:phage shock protein A
MPCNDDRFLNQFGTNLVPNKRNEKSLKLQLTTDQDRVTVNEIPKTRNCFRTVHRQRLNQVEPNFKKGIKKFRKMDFLQQFIKLYLNNVHNLLFLFLVVVAIISSLLPEFLVLRSGGSLSFKPESNEIPLSNVVDEQRYLALKENYDKSIEEYKHLKIAFDEVHEDFSYLKRNYQKLERDYHEQVEKQLQFQMTCATEVKSSGVDGNEQPVQSPVVTQQINDLKAEQSKIDKEVKELLAIQQQNSEKYNQLNQLLSESMLKLEEEESFITNEVNSFQEKAKQTATLAEDFSQQTETVQRVYSNLNQIYEYIPKVITGLKEKIQESENRCQQRLIEIENHNLKSQQEHIQTQITTLVNEEIHKNYPHLLDNASASSPPSAVEPTLLTEADLNQICPMCPHSANPAHGHHPPLAPVHPHHHQQRHVTDPAHSVEEKLDYALLAAGSEIVFNHTSSTYLPNEMRIRSLLERTIKAIGVEEYLPQLPPSSSLIDLDSSHKWTETLGFLYGIGAVEDVLKPEIQLGSCWPMNVCMLFSKKSITLSSFNIVFYRARSEY